MITYRVKVNDTLSVIARKHNTTVEALVASNGIKNPDRIYVGQVLQIPTNNTTLYNALVTCLDAIEQLPEFKQLEALLHG